MLCFPCSAAFQTATTRRRSYTERQSRTRSTSSMILALLHNCHESKNDVRNALAAQIRKLEPKNYLESTLGRVGSLHNTNGGPPAFLCSRVELSLSVRRLRPSGPTESARAPLLPEDAPTQTVNRVHAVQVA